MLKGMGTRVGSHSPLTQLVLIALRKCSHIPFNPINPEIVVKMSGSIYDVFWRWRVVGVRKHVCSIARASRRSE